MFIESISIKNHTQINNGSLILKLSDKLNKRKLINNSLKSKQNQFHHPQSGHLKQLAKGIQKYIKKFKNITH